MHDDSDMKIAGQEYREELRSPVDHEIDRLYERHRSCGNITRAQRLGASLAEYMVSNAAGENGVAADCVVLPPSADARVALHVQLLSIFALVTGVENSMPDKLLTRACLNVFYDSLKKERPHLYDAMSASGAFSFYYLNYRRGGSGSITGIASDFAMLCGSRDDKELYDLGLSVFQRFNSYACSLIRDMVFC